MKENNIPQAPKISTHLRNVLVRSNQIESTTDKFFDKNGQGKECPNNLPGKKALHKRRFVRTAFVQKAQKGNNLSFN